MCGERAPVHAQASTNGRRILTDSVAQELRTLFPAVSLYMPADAAAIRTTAAAIHMIFFLETEAFAISCSSIRLLPLYT